jgi:hypothetical protein
MARALVESLMLVDVESLLASVSVPTLVVHRTQDVIPRFLVWTAPALAESVEPAQPKAPSSGEADDRMGKPHRTRASGCGPGGCGMLQPGDRSSPLYQP